MPSLTTTVLVILSAKSFITTAEGTRHPTGYFLSEVVETSRQLEAAGVDGDGGPGSRGDPSGMRDCDRGKEYFSVAGMGSWSFRPVRPVRSTGRHGGFPSAPWIRQL